MKLNELMEKRESLVGEAGLILEAAEGKNRDLNETEQADYDGLMADVDALDRRVNRAEAHEARLLERAASGQGEDVTAPNLNTKTKRGETAISAYCHFIRTGDKSSALPVSAEFRADQDMGAGVATGGQTAVPVGHYNNIIAKREYSMLAGKLGVMPIPGKGTTVDVPTDDSTGGDFVDTAEFVATDRDTPLIGEKSMTLKKYTKRIPLSWELMADEDSNLMAFIENWVGRKMAATHNGLLLAEVGTNGSNLDTFASATAIAAGELEPIVGGDPISPYLEEEGGAWVMRSSTLWAIRAITGDNRLYAEQNAQSLVNGGLLGYDVEKSIKADAIAASAKSVYFGNWGYVGLREAPEFEVIRDPYSEASTGKIVLHYYFRAVYGVLQPDAVGYADQAAV